MRWIKAARRSTFGFLCVGLACVATFHTGCAVQVAPSPKHTVASPSTIVKTDFFDLAAEIGPGEGAPVGSTRILTVYLEGDGHAWTSRTRPSTNPTPLEPIGLELAYRHPGPSPWAYLARPCQYLPMASTRNCDPRYWTSARFAPEVIRATSQAIDALKRSFGAQGVELVGFSGGGAVALLVAATRDDVERVLTVAGNLDHAAWTQELRVSHLAESLNPKDFASALSPIPQIHWFGGADSRVPPKTANGYFDALNSEHKAQRRVIQEFDHSCCWAQNWPTLYPRLP
jgi:pimeloyl-ACP methyl ester carboxylesterase